MDSMSHSQTADRISDFLSRIRSWDGEALLIVDESLGETNILGFHKEKWYVAGSDMLARDKVIEFSKLVRKGQPITKEIKSTQSHFLTLIRFQSKTNAFFRVCAKIAFNYLCLAKAAEFVLRPCFDPIRNWILLGGDNIFAETIRIDTSGISPIADGAFPPYAHKVFIFSDGLDLLAFVSFYGGYHTTIVKLSSGETHDIFDGFVCDWRTSSEVTLAEYIASLRAKG
jgi:hypothetical protein